MEIALSTLRRYWGFLSAYKRRREFEKRSTNENTLRHIGRKWRYIPVHHFDQVSCDAYWLYENDVYFLELIGVNVSDFRKEGLYMRGSGNGVYRFCLHAVVESPRISRTTLENTMCEFSEIIDSGCRKINGQKLVRVN